jgi:hypothetical protein
VDKRVGLFDDLVGAHNHEGEYYKVTCYGLGTTQSTTYASNSYALYWSCDIEVSKNG